MEAPTAAPGNRVAVGSPSYIGMITIGFGLCLAWQNTLMNPTLLPPAIEGYSVGNWFYAQDVVFLACLSVLGYIAYKKGFLPKRQIIFWCGACMMALGSALQYVFAYQDALNFVGALIGYFFSTSRAVLILLWGELLCSVSPRSSLICIAGGYAIGFIFNLMLASMAAPLVFIAHVLFPLASAAIYHVLLSDPDSGLVKRGNSRVMLAGFPWALLVGIGLFGFVMRLLFNFSEMRVSVPDEISTVYAGIAVPTLILLAAVFYKQEIDYTKFCRLIMPAIVLLALAIAMSETGHQSYEAFFIGCVWVFYKMFSWAITRAVAYKSTLPPITIFAIANVVFNIFTYLPLLVIGLFPIPQRSIVNVAIIVGSALLIAVFLLRDDKLENVFSQEKKTFERILRVNREGTVEECVNLASAEFGLTEREQEIALKVLQGESNETILGELYISKNTLRTHMHNIYEKTDTHSREDLINLLLSYRQ